MNRHGLFVISATLFLVAPGGRPLHAGELRIERVFGPEVPTGPYKHPACMTELKNGDLYLVYYGGAGRVCRRHRGLRLATQEGRSAVDDRRSRSRTTRSARSATA